MIWVHHLLLLVIFISWQTPLTQTFSFRILHSESLFSLSKPRCLFSFSFPANSAPSLSAKQKEDRFIYLYCSWWDGCWRQFFGQIDQRWRCYWFAQTHGSDHPRPPRGLHHPWFQGVGPRLASPLWLGETPRLKGTILLCILSFLLVFPRFFISFDWLEYPQFWLLGFCFFLGYEFRLELICFYLCSLFGE